MIFIDIDNNILKKFKKYTISIVEGGASKKIFYKLQNKNTSLILINFLLDKKEFENHIKVYNLLKNIDISIPKIIEVYDDQMMILTEDLGNLRFDMILEKYDLKKLLHYAVDTLIIIKNSIKFDQEIKLPQYNLNILKKEILELTEFYLPYIGLNNKDIIQEFIDIWFKAYKKINFNFNSFVHKDYNINNLILIPSKKNHLKCGVIDFQNAFWGENCWDLFSLLEDSRVLFSDQFNEYFIDYFYLKTNLDITKNIFKMKYHFLNCSRQTRLLGRWIKLSQEKNDNFYLNFIPVTKKTLK